jgi:hypothetical protein
MVAVGMIDDSGSALLRSEECESIDPVDAVRSNCCRSLAVAPLCVAHLDSSSRLAISRFR